MSCFVICHRHIQLFVSKKRLRLQFARINCCNGLNFLSFSCCLLFCAGGNPIGGLGKSQNKCFQMMMSCRRKKEKISKRFSTAWLSEKKSHKALTLICCWHKSDRAVRQRYTDASVCYFRILCAKRKRNGWLHWRSTIAAWFQAINHRVMFKLVGAIVEESQS